MHVAILTFEGYNELDSLIALGVLNRVRSSDWRVTIATPAPMVAAFMVEGIEAPLVATYDSANRRLSMPGPMPIPPGKSAQLWAIVGDEAPQPLGLFHAAGERVEANAHSAAPMLAGTRFAISLEPIGGSPTGLPTGPVVASATLVRA